MRGKVIAVFVRACYVYYNYRMRITGDRQMRKRFSKIVLVLLTLTTMAALSFLAGSCAQPNASIDSNWELDCVVKDGKTTDAVDIKVIDQPGIIIDSDDNVTFYFDHEIHYGRINGQEGQDTIVTLNDTDEKLYLRIAGDSLRVSINGSDDNLAVFKAAKEKALIPIVESEGTCDISVKGSGNITVEFTNNGNEIWCFGEYYRLEVQKEGIWCYVPSNEPVAVHDLGHELQPGQTDSLTYDLKPYGKIRPGDYRLAVGGIGDNTNFYYVYFTVTEDGSLSFE